MATAVADARASVLVDVPWDVYRSVRSARGNRHLRMTYHDGTLILMSPEYVHEFSAERLGLIVRAVAAAGRIPVAGTRTTTFWRQGRNPHEGSGKEPDSGFYVGASEARIRGKDTIDLEVDPPPDLAIEVDNKSDSEVALPIYARLRVPEVWRYHVQSATLWFGRLTDAGTYESIERSRCLPALTPELVLSALARCREMGETAWNDWLRDWARGLDRPGAAP
jgi:Uma2 family endonuclease